MENNNQPQYYNKDNNLSEIMSVKEWIGTILLLVIPIANIVLLFVWAFGGEVKQSKRNFSRAYLILAGILLAIYIGIIILAVVLSLAVRNY